jgi:hypothetical protein
MQPPRKGNDDGTNQVRQQKGEKGDQKDVA